MVRGSRELASRQATARLTALEQDTLTLFASVRSYTEIAEARGITTVTVRNTLYLIQDKLEVGKKQELVIWAVRNGLVDDVVVGGDAQPVPERGSDPTMGCCDGSVGPRETGGDPGTPAYFFAEPCGGYQMAKGEGPGEVNNIVAARNGGSVGKSEGLGTLP